MDPGPTIDAMRTAAQTLMSGDTRAQLHAVQAAQDALDATKAVLLAELDASKDFELDGASTLNAWVRNELRMNAGQATTLVKNVARIARPASAGRCRVVRRGQLGPCPGVRLRTRPRRARADAPVRGRLRPGRTRSRTRRAVRSRQAPQGQDPPRRPRRRLGTRHGQRRLQRRRRPRRLARVRLPQHRHRREAQEGPRLGLRTTRQGRHPHRIRSAASKASTTCCPRCSATVCRRTKVFDPTCRCSSTPTRCRLLPSTSKPRPRSRTSSPNPCPRGRASHARRTRRHRPQPAHVLPVRQRLHRLPHETRRRSTAGADPQRRHRPLPTHPHPAPRSHRPPTRRLRSTRLQPHPPRDPPHHLLVTRRTNRPRPPRRTLRPMPPPAPPRTPQHHRQRRRRIRLHQPTPPTHPQTTKKPLPPSRLTKSPAAHRHATSRVPAEHNRAWPS